MKSPKFELQSSNTRPNYESQDKHPSFARFWSATLPTGRFQRAPNLLRTSNFVIPSFLLLILLSLATAPPLDAATFTVHMSNFAFVPQEQTVNVGDTVTWENQDQAGHTTTSGTGGVPSGLWSSPLLGQGGSFSFTFNVPAGRYNYYCVPHFQLGMTGAIIVQAVVANVPPTVSIQAPANGAAFSPGDTISVQASAADSDGTVTRVDFTANGSAIGSATSAPYTASFKPAAPGTYAITAVAVDNQGASSAPATVNISVTTPTAQPTIITPPQSQTVAEGAPVTFTVAASGTPPLSYQWLFNGAELTGQTGATLNLSAVTPAQAGNYAVVVRNSVGSITSAAAQLTVTSKPPQTTAPIVAITEPKNAAKFPLNTAITVQADASAKSGTLTQVEFFNGPASVGVVTAPPFRVTLGNLVQGTYTLTAVASDSLGQKTTSAPVTIEVSPAPPTESTPPTVRITTSPRNFARLNSPVVALAGTAADNAGIDHVEVQVNGGDFQPASGTASWTANVTLSPGNNIIRVRAVDLSGNTSQPATRYFTLLVSAQLRITVVGDGRVTPNLENRTLQAGKVYSLTAIPRPGSVFAGWSGGAQSSSPRLSFTMQPDLQLVATFVPNPFIPLAGSYRGLFFPDDAVTPDNSGSVQIQLSNLGAVTGKLTLHGRAWSFHTKFEALSDGSTFNSPTVSIVRPGRTPLTVTLQLDPGAQQIRGTVTDGTWTAQLMANRLGFLARTKPAPQAGRHNFLIQRATGDNTAPETVANGVLTVTTSGQVRIQGTLADRRKFTFSTIIAQDGNVPFYVPLNRGAEVLIGWLVVPSDASSAPTGTILHVKSDPPGFSEQLEAVQP